MRQLILRFKKLLSINLVSSKQFQYALVTISASIITFSSCRINQMLDSNLSSTAERPFVRTEVINFKNSDIQLLSLKIQTCSRIESLPETWDLEFDSLFGPNSVRFIVDRQAKSTTALINGNTFELADDFPLSADYIQKACHSDEDDQLPKDGVLISEDENQRVMAFLTAMAPACNFATRNQRIFCEMEQITAKMASTELEAIHQGVIKTFSRQPYLLMRRLNITITLANALANPNPDPELDTFCKILNHSFPAELPIALRFPNWHDAVCVKPIDERVAAGKSALLDALKEIKHLKRAAQTEVFQGLLTVRFSGIELPSRNLWVRLSPKASIPFVTASSHATATSEIIPASDLSAAFDDQAVTDQTNSVNAKNLFQLCWHPLYNNSSHLLAAVEDLGLIAGQKTSNCKAKFAPISTATQVVDDTDNYINRSIASETEFSITNGRSKLLRLPSGEYDYQIFPFPQISETWETRPEPELFSGTLQWQGRKPQVVINKP